MTGIVDRAAAAREATQAKLLESRRPVAGDPQSDEDAQEMNVLWGEPIPFGRSAPTPEIPASILPGVFGKFSEAVANNLQVPSALAVAYVLAALSVACQRKFRVAPYADGGYDEPVNLWMLAVAESGERKSQTARLATRPLAIWERRRFEEEKFDLAKAESERRIAQKRAEKLENDATKEDDPARRAALAREAAELKAGMPEERAPTQLFSTDITPEEAQAKTAAQGGKYAVISDEPAFFGVLAGAYSSGPVMIEFYLQAHSGADVRVHRRTRCADIERVAVTLGLAVQPGILAGLPPAANLRFRHSGLWARFLPVFPASRVGKRDVRRRAEISKELQIDYDRAVMALLDHEPENGEENRLALGAEALELWLSLSEEIEAGQGVGGEYEDIRDWTAKLPGAALRLAGLLHLAEHGAARGAELDIGKDTALRAVSLALLLVDHARAVFGFLGADKSADDARAVWEWIVASGQAAFMRNDAYKKFHCRFGKVEALIEALDVLKGRNLIRGPIKRKPKAGGRPGHLYMVNPDAFPTRPEWRASFKPKKPKTLRKRF